MKRIDATGAAYTALFLTFVVYLIPAFFDWYFWFYRSGGWAPN